MLQGAGREVEANNRLQKASDKDRGVHMDYMDHKSSHKVHSFADSTHSSVVAADNTEVCNILRTSTAFVVERIECIAPCNCQCWVRVDTTAFVETG